METNNETNDAISSDVVEVAVAPAEQVQNEHVAVDPPAEAPEEVPAIPAPVVVHHDHVTHHPGAQVEAEAVVVQNNAEPPPQPEMAADDYVEPEPPQPEPPQPEMAADSTEGVPTGTEAVPTVPMATDEAVPTETVPMATETVPTAEAMQTEAVPAEAMQTEAAPEVVVVPTVPEMAPAPVIESVATMAIPSIPPPPPPPLPIQVHEEHPPPKANLKFDLLGNAAVPSGPKDRDIIVGEDSRDHKANLLLQDLIALHRLLWEVSHERMPTEESEIETLTERLFQLLKKGKGREVAGMKDVPRSFLVGSGRFMQKEGGEWRELTDSEARQSIQRTLFAAFLAGADSGDSESLKALGKEFHEFILAQQKDAAESQQITMKPIDVVMLQRTDGETDKSFDSQVGNKTLFTLASQHVKSDNMSPTKRLEAALSVFMAKGAEAIPDEMGEHKDEKKRFILCTSKDDQKAFTLMNPVDAAEVTLLFVFEVWLEKELTSRPVIDGNGDMAANIDPKPSSDPVDKPTPHDVLFGRGGMTNSHPGNKRFRDVITLHRPDYIKAIKNDKPNVARRIVRAIRTASPPGRFLKKGEDGLWYDVGNKVAAEKASQALREKSNAEKRQRAAQRDSMRSKNGELDVGGPSKRAKTSDTPPSITIVSPLLANQLNYVGAPAASTQTLASDVSKTVNVTDPGKDEFKTEGLPPNAVDKDGNILVTDWDILCGRGGLTNHHRGNKRFRDIVALHRPDYIRAPKVQKPSVARVIVRAIRNGDPPGRFLKKDEKTGKWYDVGDKKAAEKTSQALREKGSDKGERRDSAAAGDAKSPAFLLPSPSGVAADPNVLPALKAEASAVAPEAMETEALPADPPMVAAPDQAVVKHETHEIPSVPVANPTVVEHVAAAAEVPNPHEAVAAVGEGAPAAVVDVAPEPAPMGAAVSEAQEEDIKVGEECQTVTV
ncbi:Transcriptional regulator [Seminavis robusta]|uniref:Transcriptional regulator n=1 Tax=Seminavis robusta TaxID=568900 RepID=A0A9N8E9X8_9STRA|nr:Transcriptional regulator [Seminavis robusta]|eukprot:Sro657_g182600.1 Transcriptional regulator (946) ;mRNA; r:47398-51446